MSLQRNSPSLPELAGSSAIRLLNREASTEGTSIVTVRKLNCANTTHAVDGTGADGVCWESDSEWLFHILAPISTKPHDFWIDLRNPR